MVGRPVSGPTWGRWAVAVVFAVASGAEARAAAPEAPDEAPTPVRTSVGPTVRAEVGFAHWFGTFGTPEGLRTPMVAVGFRPGGRLALIEVGARYTGALQAVTLATAADVDDPRFGAPQHPGFATAEIGAVHGITAGRQRIDVRAGVFGGLDHGPDGVGPVGGAAFGARWLFAVGGAWAGIALAARDVRFDLPGETVALARHDGQVDIGFVLVAL